MQQTTTSTSRQADGSHVIPSILASILLALAAQTATGTTTRVTTDAAADTVADIGAAADTTSIVTGTAPFESWRVAYASRGEGERAIVFVHGWAADRHSFRGQLERSGTDRRQIAVDLIGHGESSKPEVTYSMGLLARSVAAVLDHLEIRSAVLVGHSNGVPVVREFYRLFPQRTEALVVIDGPLRQVVPRATLEAMIAPMRGPDYKNVLKQLGSFTRPTGSMKQDDIDRLTAAMTSTPQHVLLGTFQAQFEDGIFREDAIDRPLLAVYAQNPMWPYWNEDYEAFVRRIASDVRYHSWEGASHLLHLERADEFHKLLLDFLERIDSAAKNEPR